MSEKKLEVYIYFILLATALFLGWKIFEPYIFAISIAAVFAVVFNPLHKKVLRRVHRHRSLAAFLTLVVISTVVLLPLVLYGIQLSDEVKNFYDYAFYAVQGGGIMTRLTDTINNIISTFSPVGVHWPVFDVAETESYVFATLAWVRGHFGDIFAGLTKFFFNLFIFLFALYYFLRDGEVLKEHVIRLSPFADHNDREILEKLEVAVMSVIKGSMVVAFVQGLMTGIGFYMFGVPSALLWGGVTVIAALVPGVGTSLVLIPAVLFLVLSGLTTHALGLALWGILCVGLIDNVLGPKLIEHRLKIHPLLILLSVLGGLSYFGPAGFLFGPLTLAFIFALFDIYKTIISKEKKIIP